MATHNTGTQVRDAQLAEFSDFVRSLRQRDEFALCEPKSTKGPESPAFGNGAFAPESGNSAKDATPQSLWRARGPPSSTFGDLQSDADASTAGGDNALRKEIKKLKQALEREAHGRRMREKQVESQRLRLELLKNSEKYVEKLEGELAKEKEHHEAAVRTLQKRIHTLEEAEAEACRYVAEQQAMLLRQRRSLLTPQLKGARAVVIAIEPPPCAETAIQTEVIEGRKTAPRALDGSVAYRPEGFALAEPDSVTQEDVFSSPSRADSFDSAQEDEPRSAKRKRKDCSVLPPSVSVSAFRFPTRLRSPAHSRDPYMSVERDSFNDVTGGTPASYYPSVPNSESCRSPRFADKSPERRDSFGAPRGGSRAFVPCDALKPQDFTAVTGLSHSVSPALSEADQKRHKRRRTSRATSRASSEVLALVTCTTVIELPPSATLESKVQAGSWLLARKRFKTGVGSAVGLSSGKVTDGQAQTVEFKTLKRAVQTVSTPVTEAACQAVVGRASTAAAVDSNLEKRLAQLQAQLEEKGAQLLKALGVVAEKDAVIGALQATCDRLMLMTESLGGSLDAEDREESQELAASPPLPPGRSLRQAPLPKAAGSNRGKGRRRGRLKESDSELNSPVPTIGLSEVEGDSDTADVRSAINEVSLRGSRRGTRTRTKAGPMDSQGSSEQDRGPNSPFSLSQSNSQHSSPRVAAKSTTNKKSTRSSGSTRGRRLRSAALGTRASPRNEGRDH